MKSLLNRSRPGGMLLAPAELIKKGGRMKNIIV
jgi:hypothetical protein